MRIPPGKKTVLRAGAIAVSLSLIAIACGDGVKPSAGAGGGTSDAGAGIDQQVVDDDSGARDGGLVLDTPDANGGAVTCPVPALGGATVFARFIGGSPPADTGGIITPGTYDLTGLEVYDGASAEADGGIDAGIGSADHARATFVLTASMIELAKTATTVLSGGAAVTTAFIAKQHVSDVFLVLDDTCPGTDSRQIPFTATTTTITLHSAMSRREIYTLRP
jgi:hypothetical protein